MGAIIDPCCNNGVNQATMQYVKEKIDEAVIEAGAITPEIVDDKIDTALEDYYTKDEVDNLIPDLTGYATEEWVEEQGYLTEHQSLEGYATEEWVGEQGYLTEHQSIKTINGQSLIGTGDITITTPDIQYYDVFDTEYIDERIEDIVNGKIVLHFKGLSAIEPPRFNVDNNSITLYFPYRFDYASQTDTTVENAYIAYTITQTAASRCDIARIDTVVGHPAIHIDLEGDNQQRDKAIYDLMGMVGLHMCDFEIHNQWTEDTETLPIVSHSHALTYRYEEGEYLKVLAPIYTKNEGTVRIEYVTYTIYPDGTHQEVYWPNLPDITQ